jgi:multidrug efflux pump subunit AcrA (membrane-fusion protein)
MKNKKVLMYAALGLVALFVLYSVFFSDDSEADTDITVKVRKGEFLNEVVISGEAQSTSSIKINGPGEMRKFNLYRVKIQDLIPEGTLVKEGDYVGKLDRSELNGKIIDAQLNLEKAQSKFTQEQLDTTLTLKQERTAIKDLEFTLAEDKLELERSIYEPPSTIKQLEIKIERAERDLKEKKEDYYIKRRKAIAKMAEVGTEVSKINKQLEDLNSLLKSFTIYSTANGMVIYAKNWDGSKRTVGTEISPWDPTLATLPDLTKMESKTYANEVDIRMIEKDQEVTIGFDAFPDVSLTGTVSSVANVGEKKRGSDINLFQVLIKLKEGNDQIRPGMTTSNRILIDKETDVLVVPLEAIFKQDSTSYVYVKSGFSTKKKEVALGKSNLEEVIVTEGLKANELIYLSKPAGLEEDNIEALK